MQADRAGVSGRLAVRPICHVYHLPDGACSPVRTVACEQCGCSGEHKSRWRRAYGARPAAEGQGRDRQVRLPGARPQDFRARAPRGLAGRRLAPSWWLPSSPASSMSKRASPYPGNSAPCRWKSASTWPPSGSRATRSDSVTAAPNADSSAPSPRTREAFASHRAATGTPTTPSP